MRNFSIPAAVKLGYSFTFALSLTTFPFLELPYTFLKTWKTFRGKKSFSVQCSRAREQMFSFIILLHCMHCQHSY